MLAPARFPRTHGPPLAAWLPSICQQDNRDRRLHDLPFKRPTRDRSGHGVCSAPHLRPSLVTGARPTASGLAVAGCWPTPRPPVCRGTRRSQRGTNLAFSTFQVPEEVGHDWAHHGISLSAAARLIKEEGDCRESRWRTASQRPSKATSKFETPAARTFSSSMSLVIVAHRILDRCPGLVWPVELIKIDAFDPKPPK
jgi:hypothetical protein